MERFAHPENVFAQKEKPTATVFAGISLRTEHTVANAKMLVMPVKFAQVANVNSTAPKAKQLVVVSVLYFNQASDTVVSAEFRVPEERHAFPENVSVPKAKAIATESASIQTLHVQTAGHATRLVKQVNCVQRANVNSVAQVAKMPVAASVSV